jgi:hypothetical protein
MATRSVVLLGTLVALPSPAGAQPAPGRTFGSAYAIEATGGVLGSAFGIGVGVAVVRPDECDAENLECILRGVGAVGLVGALTAPLGSYAAGRAFDTQPSPWGAFLGSVAGLAAGVGVIKLVDEAGGRVEGAGAVIAVSLTHGVVTALGSRLVAGLRD